ncbi:MAG: PQQ-binding-like beta-propeller repeat protein, partial [Actinomycetota bacterium]
MKRDRVLSLAVVAFAVSALGACAQRPEAAALPTPAAPASPPAGAQAALPEAVPKAVAAATKDKPQPPARGEQAAAAAEPVRKPAGVQVAQRPATTSPRPGAATSDWAQFRGPGGMGAGIGRGTPTAWSAESGIRWKTPLPGAGTSTPIVLGQRIYVTCYTGSPEEVKRHLTCLDRETGKQIWSVEVPGRGPEESSIRENHGYASNSPAADAERVYAFFGRSGVYAFDHSGKQLWRADVGERTHGCGSAASPVLPGNLVIVNASVESDSLVALDKTTGKEVWRAGGIKESWNTPILTRTPEGKSELVVAIFQKVLGFDPTTGQQLWSCNTDINWYMVPSLVARDGVVYCIGGRGGGGSLAIRLGGRGDVTKTHVIWRYEKGLPNIPSPLL